MYHYLQSPKPKSKNKCLLFIKTSKQEQKGTKEAKQRGLIKINLTIEVNYTIIDRTKDGLLGPKIPHAICRSAPNAKSDIVAN